MTVTFAGLVYYESLGFFSFFFFFFFFFFAGGNIGLPGERSGVGGTKTRETKSQNGIIARVRKDLIDPGLYSVQCILVQKCDGL